MVRTLLCSTDLTCRTTSSPASEVAAETLSIRYPVGSSTVQLCGFHVHVSNAPGAPHSEADEDAPLRQLVKVTVRLQTKGEEEGGNRGRSFVLGIIFLRLPDPAEPPLPISASFPPNKAASSKKFNPFAASLRHQTDEKKPMEEGAKVESPNLAVCSSVVKKTSTDRDETFVPSFVERTAAFVPLDYRSECQRLSMMFEVEVVDVYSTFPWLPRVLGKRRREREGEEERKEKARRAHDRKEKGEHVEAAAAGDRKILVKISVVGAVASLLD